MYARSRSATVTPLRVSKPFSLTNEFYQAPHLHCRMTRVLSRKLFCFQLVIDSSTASKKLESIARSLCLAPSLTRKASQRRMMIMRVYTDQHLTLL